MCLYLYCGHGTTRAWLQAPYRCENICETHVCVAEATCNIHMQHMRACIRFRAQPLSKMLLLLSYCSPRVMAQPSRRHDTSLGSKKPLGSCPEISLDKQNPELVSPSMKGPLSLAPTFPLSSLRASRAVGTAICQTCASDTLLVGRVVLLRLGSQLIQLRLVDCARPGPERDPFIRHIMHHKIPWEGESADADAD